MLCRKAKKDNSLEVSLADAEAPNGSSPSDTAAPTEAKDPLGLQSSFKIDTADMSSKHSSFEGEESLTSSIRHLSPAGRHSV